LLQIKFGFVILGYYDDKEITMSLIKVAQQAGVSVATVSRVINDKPGISSDTRAVVLSTIGELGYSPKPVASRPGPKASSKRNSQMVNVLFLSFAKYKSQTNSPVYAEIIHGVEAELASQGMAMIFKQVNACDDISEWISDRDIDGIVLFSPSAAITEWIRANCKNIPVVSILGDSSSRWCDLISYDKPAVAELAINYLRDKGYDTFLEIHTSNHSVRLHELAQQYGMRIITLADSAEGIFITNETENRPDQAGLAKLFDDYLAGNKLPHAIFLPCDAFAVPVYSILMRKGLLAGRDFEAVSVNNEKSLLDGLMPRPATVDIRSYEMGRAAVQRLQWRKTNRDEPRMTLRVDPLMVMPDGKHSV
jgi:LacI family transcriptional regulator